ncbi:MAG TPA: hypothetical protein VNO43_07240 [Candidatus Eisenbacteria bacterium]|nr:hypothetical protein [Candidatus Eisenbacteria bacterium]
MKSKRARATVHARRESMKTQGFGSSGKTLPGRKATGCALVLMVPAAFGLGGQNSGMAHA